MGAAVRRHLPELRDVQGMLKASAWVPLTSVRAGAAERVEEVLLVEERHGLAAHVLDDLAAENVAAAVVRPRRAYLQHGSHAGKISVINDNVAMPTFICRRQLRYSLGVVEQNTHNNTVVVFLVNDGIIRFDEQEDVVTDTIEKKFGENTDVPFDTLLI